MTLEFVGATSPSGGLYYSWRCPCGARVHGHVLTEASVECFFCHRASRVVAASSSLCSEPGCVLPAGHNTDFVL